jgi:hypothetical protein
MSEPDYGSFLQSRRRAISLLGGGVAALLGGCCELRGFPKPQIVGGADSRGIRGIEGNTFLAPRAVNTRGVPTTSCVDVHAHFFNASDVTVKGYLEGPVAYSMQGVLRELMKLLAPLGDALAELAPTAKREYDELHGMSLTRANSSALRATLESDKTQERHLISTEFNRLVQSARGKPFREAYARAMQPTARSGLELRPRIRQIDEESVLKAMSLSESSVSNEQLRRFIASDQAPYAEGILAFIGYMLSSRKSNLLTYQGAFTEQQHTLGVRRTLGLMVDFDHWLACPPRSAHEDQMKLHLKISHLSDSYMLPVISYNPWSDVVNRGRSLELVEEAVRAGFVAVKIYPPNGFRPWANKDVLEPPHAPTGAQLDEALQRFWLKCEELQVPVIAHASPSMGSDAAHNAFGGPPGWQALLEAPFWTGDEAPRVSLGHFGGDSDAGGNDWTQGFADLMAKPRGRHLYADLAYWSDLECAAQDEDNCKSAEARLSAVLTKSVGQDQLIADRIMYGSDWLMLSREKNWPAYAQELHAAVRDIAAPYVERIFGGNARWCFGDRLALG